MNYSATQEKLEYLMGSISCPLRPTPRDGSYPIHSDVHFI